MSNSSWAPDEDAATIFAEDKWLQGALLMCIAYGSAATLCIQCFTMLLVGGLMKLDQQAFVDDRNYPGGPSAYETAPVPVDLLANDCIPVSTLISDALLLWRCTVIYKNSRIPGWVTNLLAIIIWVIEIVLGILFILNLSPSTHLGNLDVAIAFWAFSLAVNVFVTLAIVGRILLFRYRYISIIGKEHTANYAGVIAMVIESELLYSIFLILFIVPYGLQNLLTAVFIPSLSLVQVIAALMIVYRVAQGKAWQTDTHAQMSSLNARRTNIQFNNMSRTGATSGSTVVDLNAGVVNIGEVEGKDKPIHADSPEAV
ncbi:hypothetical protein EIP86_010362 [Pleurotus ostreatoroseus]|nr:hypothetical protein EIP86_010362 [Pleurotus ostreatoroseus]